MKRTISVFLAILIIAAAVPFAGAADAVTVDGSWSILLPENPSSFERFAARKLSNCLGEVFGKTPEIVKAASGNHIAVGSASRADVSGLAENGYRIQVINGNIHIGGTGVRGLQAGVYRFLEEFLDRKVYTSEIIVMPKAEAIEIPAGTDIVYEPFFEYTETDWPCSYDAEYSIANGLTGGVYRQLPDETGGTVNYLGGFCHTMRSLCESGSFVESHPEYLALHDGKRTADQPCLTEPEVLRIATANVLSLLEREHDPDASLEIVSVTQNDNMNYCECERCKSFEAGHGGVQSATMLNFANQIADAVKEEGYENVAIDTFAYQYTRKAPTGIVPRDNVIVRLCTIECCFTHALDNRLCKDNRELMNDLRDWSEICDRLYIWDYTNNFWNSCVVFPDFDVIRRNIQIFYENNVRGVFEEGNYYMRNCDAEFGDLRSYMISKCLQDPYCDLESEINGFLSAFYGPAGKTMRKIVDMYASHGPSSFLRHLSIGENPRLCFLFTPRALAKMDALWARAEKEAETDEQRSRVERSELSWRFWKACVGRGEFSLLNPGRFDENEKLFDDLKAFGVKQLNESGYGDYLDCACIRYAPADKWNDYEEGEDDSASLQAFGKFCEKYLVPVLSAFGLYYKFVRAVNGIGLS